MYSPCQFLVGLLNLLQERISLRLSQGNRFLETHFLTTKAHDASIGIYLGEIINHAHAVICSVTLAEFV
jgi:hypothetical protein